MQKKITSPALDSIITKSATLKKKKKKDWL